MHIHNPYREKRTIADANYARGHGDPYRAIPPASPLLTMQRAFSLFYGETDYQLFARNSIFRCDPQIERNLWRSNRIVRLEIRIHLAANTSIRNRCCCKFTQTDIVRVPYARRLRAKGRGRKIRGNEENCSWNKFSSFRSAILLLAYKLIHSGPADPRNLLLPRDKRVSSVWKDRARCETHDAPFWYAQITKCDGRFRNN